jgi:hypothetical protein
MFESADWINLQKTVDGRESAEYRKRREELHHAELELMRQRERVAEMRRASLDANSVCDKCIDKLNLVEEYGRGETFGLIPVILVT